jgi:hypothetical protein
MRYGLLMAAAVAAIPFAALAQGQAAPAASAWGFFDAGTSSGAGVQAADGAQLIFKCDKPGKKEVYVVVVSPKEELGAPSITTPISRPVSFSLDGKPPVKDNWRFYQRSAVATGKTADRALPRFIQMVSSASKVEMRLDTGLRSQDVVMTFNTAGAADAIKTVYGKCKDDVPA